MTLNQAGLCALCVLGLSGGQLMFRAGAANIKGEGLIALISGLQQPLLWTALVLYGSMTILWIQLLRSIPLNIAYPFIALAFGLVPLFSSILFNEPISTPQLCGILFIISGVMIIGFSS